jgi:RNA-binding protein 25
VLLQMSDPANTESTEIAPSYNVPSHLKDLPPEELPEEHRGSVLSEIDKFRQASAAREEEKRRREKVQELERARANRDHNRGGPSGPGSNGRVMGAQDRQSYLRPVGFVASEGAEEEKNLRVDERDEREEERRKLREQEDLMRMGHDAERRFLGLERSRLSHWEREIGKDRAEDEARERDTAALKRLYESWDQNREMERNIFYVDRQRWKMVRSSVREREEREDEVDRRAQAEEEEKSRIEAEKFLAQQAEDMAAYEAEQRAAGVLISGEGVHAPLKLKVAPTGSGHGGTEEQNRPVQIGVLGNADDDSDLTGLRRGKLAHIDLHDDEMNNLSPEEKKSKIRKELPEESSQLFEKVPKWEHLEEVSHGGEQCPNLIVILTKLLLLSSDLY